MRNCRLGCAENKPLCEQGDNVSSKLREWQAANGNDGGIGTDLIQNQPYYANSRIPRVILRLLGCILTAEILEYCQIILHSICKS